MENVDPRPMAFCAVANFRPQLQPLQRERHFAPTYFFCRWTSIVVIKGVSDALCPVPAADNPVVTSVLATEKPLISSVPPPNTPSKRPYTHIYTPGNYHRPSGHRFGSVHVRYQESLETAGSTMSGFGDLECQRHSLSLSSRSRVFEKCELR